MAKAKNPEPEVTDLITQDPELAALIEADQARSAELEVAGDGSPLSLPSVVYGYEKKGKLLSFMNKLGKDDVEVISEEKSPDSPVLEIALLDQPITLRDMYDESKEEYACRALQGKPLSFIENPKAKSCEECRFDKWGPDNQKHSEDGISCRKKYLVPVVVWTNRADEEEMPVPAILVISPTGLKFYDKFTSNRRNSGAFGSGQRRRSVFDDLVQMRLATAEGKGGMYAVPKFESAGALFDPLDPGKSAVKLAPYKAFLKMRDKVRKQLKEWGVDESMAVQGEDIGATEKAYNEQQADEEKHSDDLGF